MNRRTAPVRECRFHNEDSRPWMGDSNLGSDCVVPAALGRAVCDFGKL